jgi:hypothetical protein
MAGKKVIRITAGELFDTLGTKLEVKRLVVRDLVHGLSEMAVESLKKTGEFRIPHLGRIIVKDIPMKKYPAGEYANPFKKGPDGKPVMEYKEARVRPARKKLKFIFASQVKQPVMGK